MANNQERRWLMVIGVILAVALILWVTSYVWMPLLPITEERDAGEEVIDQTYDADQAIQDYEWFRVQYNEIIEARNQLANHEQALEGFYETWGEDPQGWNDQAQTRHSRINQRITAARNQIEELVSEYNARSQQANRELFKCNLPWQVDDRLEIRGPPGSGDPDEPIQDVGPDGEPVNPDAEIPDPEQCDGLPDEIQQSATNDGN